MWVRIKPTMNRIAQRPIFWFIYIIVETVAFVLQAVHFWYTIKYLIYYQP